MDTQNGHTKKDTRKIRKPRAQDKENNRVGQPRSKTDVVILYVQDMTESLQWVFKKHDIALHSKPGYTLKQALVAPKEKLSSDEKQRVIYSVSCQGCDGEYGAETEKIKH